MKTQKLFQKLNRKKMATALKISVFAGDLAAITIYILLRVLFKGFSFPPSEEIRNFFKIIGDGALAGLVFFAFYYLIEIPEILFNKKGIHLLAPLKKQGKTIREIKMFDKPQQIRA